MAQDIATYSQTVSAAGSATVRIRPLRLQTWTVTQVAVEMPPVAGQTCELRRNGFLVSPVVPTQDAVGGDPPVLLRPSDELTVEWTNCTPGDVGKVQVFYEYGDRSA